MMVKILRDGRETTFTLTVFFCISHLKEEYFFKKLFTFYPTFDTLSKNLQKTANFCICVFLLSRLLYITEGKYWNQLKKFRKFRDVLSSGSHETGSRAKKVTASDSAKPGPHIHIIFFESGVTGTRRNGDKE